MDIQEPSHRSSFDKLQNDANLEEVGRFRRGVSWFYWLAGLSLINSILLIVGASVSFLFGLAVTQLVDGIALGLEMALGLTTPSYLTFIALGVNVLIAGFFILLGRFAGKGSQAVYAAGMVVYLLDALLALLFGDWLGVLFHAFVLFMLWRGFSALRELGPWLKAPPAEAVPPTGSTVV